ncbi:hypothetical protein CVT26_006692 [Gymnopilus dilepis]|uniref:Uncharacterized protein n=1 Tax=Gymnopilus dilepis TaxID=231916 RepID=A0A409Y2R9_9AGAR|nr:hypothetical protein CVT26_006692 [Gymnopilus dilepis]
MKPQKNPMMKGSSTTHDKFTDKEAKAMAAQQSRAHNTGLSKEERELGAAKAAVINKGKARPQQTAHKFDPHREPQMEGSNEATAEGEGAGVTSSGNGNLGIP